MLPTVTVLGHPEALDNDLHIEASVPAERSCSLSDKDAADCLNQAESPEWIDEIADIISRMEPVTPDVVRGTRVQNVLHRMGRPLRLGFSVYSLLFASGLLRQYNYPKEV